MPGLKLVVAEDLGQLVPEIASFIGGPSTDILQPFDVVVPSMGLRQWLDQELSKLDPTGLGGVAANLRIAFPRDLVVQVERLALGDAWVDWGVGATALRILGALQLDSYDEALRRAEAIDEIVRYRPALLETPGVLPKSLAEVVDGLELLVRGPQVQRRLVIEALRAGKVAQLPEELAIFGVVDLPGGPRFLELLEAVAEHCEVRVYLPVPSVSDAERVLRATTGEQDRAPRFSWTADAEDTLQLWASTSHEAGFLAPSNLGTATSLSALKGVLRAGEPSEVVSDSSVELLGAFGDSRQVEQLRDAIFEQLEVGVEPWEVLVVSPRPGDFEASLERHWAYRTWDGGDEPDAPRLPHELLEVSPEQLRNRLGTSLALLRLIGNYATLEQVVDLLLFPSVATQLGLGFEAAQEVARRAREGKLVFGVSPEQRQVFDVYPLTDHDGLAADLGTWQRVSDASAVATLYPPARSSTSAAPIRPLGVPSDLELFGRLQPLLRIFEGGADLCVPSAKPQTLNSWLGTLESWMEVAAGHGGEDDSFSRQLLRLRRELAHDEQLGELVMSFSNFVEMWAALAQARRFTRIFGKGGVVVSGLDALSWAPYKVVCILGLDAERLPAAGLPGTGLSVGGYEPRPGDPDTRRSALGKLLAAVLAAERKLIVTFNVRDEGSGQVLEPAIAMSELLDHLALATGGRVEELIEQQAEAARRHNFGGDHRRPRYDQRLTRIRDRASAVHETADGQGAVAEPVVEVTIGDLQSFLRDPVGYHLRNVENVQVPRDLEGSPVRPAVTVDGLVKYAFREAYLEQLRAMPEWEDLINQEMGPEGRAPLLERLSVAARPIFDALVASEEYAGDVPAMLWLPPDLKDPLDLMALNLRFELADLEPVDDPGDPLLQPIDLGGGRRLLLVGPHVDARDRFRPFRSTELGTPLAMTYHVRNRAPRTNDDVENIATKLVELLALRAQSGESEARVKTWFSPKSIAKAKGRSGMLPDQALRLNHVVELRAGADELSPAEARAQLAALVDLYVEGLGQRIDYFRRTSAPLAFPGFVNHPEDASRSAWEGRSGGGGSSERADVRNELLYPFEYRELLQQTRLEEYAARVGACANGVGFRSLTETKALAPAALLAREPALAKRLDEAWDLPSMVKARKWQQLAARGAEGEEVEA